MKEKVVAYITSLGDHTLILGQRLSEWCGHGPMLEVDIALTNIALDLLGQTRSYYQYAAQLEGRGRTEDDIAFLRDAWEYLNVLLVEQPNEDFAYTIVRQFFFDAFHLLFLEEMQQSADEQLAAIAAKSLKEVKYHYRFSSEWIIRLGDGTEESHQKMQQAVDDLWMYTGELCEPTELEKEMHSLGIGVDLCLLCKLTMIASLKEVLHKGYPGSSGYSLGAIRWQKRSVTANIWDTCISELQWMQRTYPDMQW